MMSSVMLIQPLAVTVATFMVYGATGNELTASIILPALSLLGMLRFPNYLPNCLPNCLPDCLPHQACCASLSPSSRCSSLSWPISWCVPLDGLFMAS